MRRAGGKRKRVGRWLLILIVAGLCVALLVINALNFFPQGSNLSPTSLAHFGISALTALVYLAVGSLVFLFARQRRVAQLLFCFALSMTVTFANETASGSRDAWFAVVTGISGVVALASFAILLLIFPYDYLAASRARKQAGAPPRPLLLMLYILVHLLFPLLFAPH